MIRRHDAGIFSICLLSAVFFSKAETKGTDNLNLLIDLASVVTEEQDSSATTPSFIVSFEVKAKDPEKKPEAPAALTYLIDMWQEKRALNYLTSAYKDHSYHESGAWAPNNSLRTFSYKPNNAELPEYSMEDFQLPVEGTFTSGYGYRPKFHRFHHGIDVALNFGDTVICSLPGIVTRVGYEPGGYGRYVVVSHSGGMETLYGHLQGSIVNPGDRINAGDPIGLGGATGNATGPHLHFETRYRGVPMNPAKWIELK